MTRCYGTFFKEAILLLNKSHLEQSTLADAWRVFQSWQIDEVRFGPWNHLSQHFIHSLRATIQQGFHSTCPTCRKPITWRSIKWTFCCKECVPPLKWGLPHIVTGQRMLILIRKEPKSYETHAVTIVPGPWYSKPKCIQDKKEWPIHNCIYCCNTILLGCNAMVNLCCGKETE